MFAESRADLPRSGRFGRPSLRKAGSISGEYKSHRSRFGTDIAPEWQRLRLVHRPPSSFPSRRRRFPRSGFPSELWLTPRGAFSDENLCTRRDPCHFGHVSVSLWWCGCKSFRVLGARERPCGRQANRRVALPLCRRGCKKRARRQSKLSDGTARWNGRGIRGVPRVRSCDDGVVQGCPFSRLPFGVLGWS